ncbi:glycosyltransferase [Candidatus Woesearchaeota archaeon]|nr:glycosyltransferase [Candidatus Woesearchaeota archaeon]
MVKFSIIIPSCNSEKYIRLCLDSILNLNYPRKDYEIMVVDGGSKDNTLNIIKKYKNIRLLHSKNISISNSRNLAAKQAKGNFLVFIDSDCAAGRELLNKAKEILKKHDFCGSFYKPSKKAGWIARAWLLNERKKRGFVDWLPGGGIIIKKRLFWEINGFNEKLETGEDFDLCYRLKKKGYKIYGDPSLASAHLGQTDSLKDFFKKEMWRGNSLIKSIRNHGLVIEEMPSTILNIYHFLAFFFLLISFIMLNIHLISFSLITLVLPSILLSFRKTIQTKRFGYFFNFITLFFVYQLARSFSIIRYNQFKDIFKTIKLRKSKVWIAWEKDASIRSAVLAKELNAKFYPIVWNKIPFLRNFIVIPRTIRAIAREKPKILFVQNPSVVLSSLAAFMKNFFDYFLVMDLHTIYYKPNIFSSLFFNKLNSYCLNKSDIIIVTNNDYKNRIEKKTNKEITILPDKIPELPSTKNMRLKGKKNIVCICSFSRSGDEPYLEIIRAAKSLNRDIFIYMTGNYKNAKVNLKNLPKNFRLTGFLDIEDYRNLIHSADIVLVLTKCDDCLVCGGYEAVAAEKPLVLSDKKVLREYFSKGTVFTANNSEQIVRAVYDALNNKEKLASDIKTLKKIRNKEWQQKWKNISNNLENVQ